jgi:histidine ammonia-lyase
VTVTLDSRREITLEAFERVAWGRESVRIDTAALQRVATAREAFLRLLESTEVTVYGVTSGYGDRAGTPVEEADRLRMARSAAFRGASFGEPLPERVTRGIVLARLANFLDGNAAVSASLVEAVAAMLDASQLPPVPWQGNGGSGEILALAHLFGPLIESTDVREKEGLALINGSPCAAALAADSALAAARRLRLAYDVFSTSVEAFRAPLDAFDAALEELWGDEHEARALERLRSRLDPRSERRPHQAPVAFRVLPRVLGQAERAVAAAADVASVSLRSVSDNPVYLPPSDDRPDGRVLSTGGYHNAAAPAALHQLAVTWADLTQLAERHVERLVHDASALSDRDEILRLLLMVAVGYAEEARAAAQPVVLPRAGPGQNDVTAPSFLTWARERAAGDSLTSTLAVLAAASSHRLDGRELGPLPSAVQAESEGVVALLAAGRTVGGELGELAARFRERLFSAAGAVDG